MGQAWSPCRCRARKSWRRYASEIHKHLSTALKRDKASAFRFYAETEEPPSPEAFRLAEGYGAALGRVLADGFGETVLREYDLKLYGLPPDETAGLYLHGDSFCGKSTAAYAFLNTVVTSFALHRGIQLAAERFNQAWHASRDEAVCAWGGIRVLEAVEFASGANKAARAGNLDGFVAGLVDPSTLVIDDLDKAKFSESTGLALFAVTKGRIEAGASRCSRQTSAPTRSPKPWTLTIKPRF